MRVLIVTDAYPPEIRSSSHLMVELAEGLRDAGHQVQVLTGWPMYNLDEEARGRVFEESVDESGIQVIRVRTLPHHNVNFFVRGVAQLLLPLQFLQALRRWAPTPPDAVLVYTPPLPLAFVGERLRNRGARYLLNVQDLFPQNAIDLGVLRGSAAIGFFRWMERRAYRNADVVTAHSQGNRDQLRAEHPKLADKIHLLHNWVDLEAGGAAPDLDFRGKWGLEGKYVALFAGVMGPSQSLDLVLDVASRLKDLPHLRFLLVGDGMEKVRLESRAAAEGLSNVVFKPFVSREAYPSLVQGVDLGLVTLSSLNKTPVVPGKILGYMAGAKPVAAFLNAESDGHEIIRDAGCGYSCRSDDPAEIEAILRRLYAGRDHAAQMGQRGARYVREHFARDAVLAEIQRLLRA